MPISGGGFVHMDLTGGSNILTGLNPIWTTFGDWVWSHFTTGGPFFPVLVVALHFA
jgi:hypothetical protein